MANFTKESLACQLQCEHKELESSQGLPFRELLSAEKIRRALETPASSFAIGFTIRW